MFSSALHAGSFSQLIVQSFLSGLADGFPRHADSFVILIHLLPSIRPAD